MKWYTIELLWFAVTMMERDGSRQSATVEKKLLPRTGWRAWAILNNIIFK